ncbi:BgTH12-01016 [Blumeria graminis f. sp. triticale]|uniref:Bgt-5189 n=2 Tax=Blumeria graminis TaxID=34373 RepID=A0A9X9MN70_BLUGR|nr:BgTH12-01016 [Blumeria graminis f. sp. triticale]VDB93658.1 Bgt-5189 [Blumeria graminis f. sp. tritici]
MKLLSNSKMTSRLKVH